MKIKKAFLASLLNKAGIKVKAELVIDDSNGTSLKFPEITDVSEIAVGVAVSVPDGPYVIPNGDNSISIMVVGGVITEFSDDSVVAEEEASEEQIEALLLGVVEENVSLKAEVAAVNAKLTKMDADFTAMKVALKHDDGKASAAAAQVGTKPNFKVI